MAFYFHGFFKEPVMADRPPRVFISYSHDSDDHADRVLALADRLRAEGIDVALDQYEISPPEGWPSWMDRQVRESDFVLVVCTEIYLRRAERREEPGAGHGVTFESTLRCRDAEHPVHPGHVRRSRHSPHPYAPTRSKPVQYQH
jgi:TIR domain